MPSYSAIPMDCPQRAAPLVAYIASMPLTKMKPDQIAEISRLVEAELSAQGGAIHITKDSGLFIAR
jgi:predicted aconitase with swiveling domain